MPAPPVAEITYVQLGLRSKVLDRLVEDRWIDPIDRSNREVIAKALERAIDWALDLAPRDVRREEAASTGPTNQSHRVEQ